MTHYRSVQPGQRGAGSSNCRLCALSPHCRSVQLDSGERGAVAAGCVPAPPQPGQPCHEGHGTQGPAAHGECPLCGLTAPPSLAGPAGPPASLMGTALLGSRDPSPDTPSLPASDFPSLPGTQCLDQALRQDGVGPPPGPVQVLQGLTRPTCWVPGTLAHLPLGERGQGLAPPP